MKPCSLGVSSAWYLNAVKERKKKERIMNPRKKVQTKKDMNYSFKRMLMEKLDKLYSDDILIAICFSVRGSLDLRFQFKPLFVNSSFISVRVKGFPDSCNTALISLSIVGFFIFVSF